MKPNLAETLPSLNERNETSTNQPSRTVRTSGWLFGIVVFGFRCRISVTFLTLVSMTTAFDPRTVWTRLAVPRVVGMELVAPRAAFRFPVVPLAVSWVAVLVWAVVP